MTLFFIRTVDQKPLNLPSFTQDGVGTIGIHPALPWSHQSRQIKRLHLPALSLPSSLPSSLLTTVDQKNGIFERFASRLRAALTIQSTV
jgi:hypothetical protein